MKSIPALLFAAALVACVFLPVSAVVAGSLLFAAGLLAIGVADYRTGIRFAYATPAARSIQTRIEPLGLAA